MIEKLTNYLIKRRLKKEHITIKDNKPNEFIRVLNTLRENKVFVQARHDGIYIRMAGDVKNDECFSTEFVKVKSIKEKHEKSFPNLNISDEEKKALYDRYSKELEKDDWKKYKNNYLL